MSPQTETVDRDGFTPAEQAYFASQGQVTDGLADDASSGSDATIPDPAVDTPKPDAGAAVVDKAITPDPDADPFDELEKSAKPTRDKAGRVIPEASYNVVRDKYKSTKAELADFKKKFEEFDTERKADRAELARERELRTRIDERLKLFNEVIAPQADAQPQKPVRPNPEEDIFGYVKWLEDTHASELAELKGQIGQTSQTIHDTTEETNLRTNYQADAQRFARDAPDFVDAYNHVNRVRDAMLESIGYADPNQRAAIRMNEEKELVATALKAGKSPAATIYGVAKSLGYVKAAPVVPAAPAAPAAAAGPSVTEEIDRIAKAQAASKSLSSGGGASVGPMTVEQLANMTEGEFEAYARKNPNVVKELMGG
jgi:enamine deaminase RidA (YjgF/YER057c/UK114 family)